VNFFSLSSFILSQAPDTRITTKRQKISDRDIEDKRVRQENGRGKMREETEDRKKGTRVEIGKLGNQVYIKNHLSK
jgi:hypothetical protein